MEIFNYKQQSDEWYKAHIGRPTSCNFSKIITTDGKPSKQRKKYIYQLVGERITQSLTSTYKNDIMQRGNDLESEAREFYSFIKDVEVQEVGFCLENNVGCSPDGLVGEDGLLEIKCPLIHTHIEYLIANELPKTYFQQVQGQLLVTGRKWVDFLSYYSGLKPLIVRVERDEKFISELREQLELACKEIDELVEKIK